MNSNDFKPYTLIPGTQVLRSKIDVFTMSDPTDEDHFYLLSHYKAKMGSRKDPLCQFLKCP